MAFKFRMVDHAGRLVVPIYYQLTGGNGTLTSGARTEVIYSDDGGNTWAHGDCLPGTVGHESVVVELPNGNLQIFMRNTSGSGGKIKTATSLDGGETWIDVTSGLGDNLAGTNSQLSRFHIVERLSRKKMDKHILQFCCQWRITPPEQMGASMSA
ncbi:MAG: exo-alpha-sialidase [Acutalibacteraceae bacterium]